MEQKPFKEEDEKEILNRLFLNKNNLVEETEDFKILESIAYAIHEDGEKKDLGLIRKIHEKQKHKKRIIRWSISIITILGITLLAYILLKKDTQAPKTLIASEITQTIIEGESFEKYTVSGTYIDTFMATNGVDSIRRLVLIVEPGKTIKSQITKRITQGESFEGYTTSGTYIDTLVASNGLDSIRVLVLKILPKVQVLKSSKNQNDANNTLFYPKEIDSIKINDSKKSPIFAELKGKYEIIHKLEELINEQGLGYLSTFQLIKPEYRLEFRNGETINIPFEFSNITNVNLPLKIKLFTKEQIDENDEIFLILPNETLFELELNLSPDLYYWQIFDSDGERLGIGSIKINYSPLLYLNPSYKKNKDETR